MVTIEARMGGCGIIPLVFIYMAPATNKYIVYITVVIIRFVIIIILVIIPWMSLNSLLCMLRFCACLYKMISLVLHVKSRWSGRIFAVSFLTRKRSPKVNSGSLKARALLVNGFLPLISPHIPFVFFFLFGRTRRGVVVVIITQVCTMCVVCYNWLHMPGARFSVVGLKWAM